MNGGTEAVPVGVVRVECGKACVYPGPAIGDVAVVEMVARVVGEDVDVEHQAFTFDNAEGGSGNFAAESLIVNGVVDPGGKAGIKFVPKSP